MMLVHNRVVALEPDRHAQEEALERYSLGQADSEECARIEEHLLICEGCRNRLEEQDLIIDSIAVAAGQWREEYPTPQRRRWTFPRFMLVFASLALVALGTLWLAGTRDEKIAPVAVTLTTTRGTSSSQAPARQPLELQPDLTALPAFPHYDWQIVDGTGGQIAKGRLAGAIYTVLKPGPYFIRIYSPANELLREYALQTK